MSKTKTKKVLTTQQRQKRAKMRYAKSHGRMHKDAQRVRAGKKAARKRGHKKLTSSQKMKISKGVKMAYKNNIGKIRHKSKSKRKSTGKRRTRRSSRKAA